MWVGLCGHVVVAYSFNKESGELRQIQKGKKIHDGEAYLAKFIVLARGCTILERREESLG